MPLVAGWSGGDEDLSASIPLLLVISVATPVWILVTLLTRPVSLARLEEFYVRVRPGGAWGPVARASGLAPTPLGGDLLLWGVSSLCIFGLLIGIGSALLQAWASAGLFLGLGAVGGLALFGLMRSEGSRRQQAADLEAHLDR